MTSEYQVDVIELQKEMVAKGLKTITALAGASGVERNTVSSIINEKTNPSLTVMYALAKALNLSSARAGEIFFAKVVA